MGAAARVSDYSRHGLGELIRVRRPLAARGTVLIRASFQHAVRAPNIGELFSPPQGTQLAIGTPPSAIGDPCDVRSTARTGGQWRSGGGTLRRARRSRRCDRQLHLSDNCHGRT